MKTKQLFICILTISLLLQSCVKDTCNGNLGNTFKDIALSEVINDTTGLVLVNLNLETLADLPEDYFSALITEDSATISAIDFVTINSSLMSVAFSAGALPDSLETQMFSLLYHFPDRREYIDCQHPGSSDSYLLELKIKLSNTDGTIEVSDFEWNELFLAGHL